MKNNAVNPVGGAVAYLGRQPIVNWKKELVGHEILFRSGKVNSADIRNARSASANVISRVLTDFGIQEVLGAYKGFFNVSNDLLLSDELELLPPEQTIIELLENVPVNETVLRRCRDLRARGYQIALDDHTFDPEMPEIYEVTDVVKVDVLNTPPARLQEVARIINRMDLIKLAEKVETLEQFQACRQLGFNLFQGYFFARPEILEMSTINASKLSVLNLLRLMVSDAEIGEIEEAFRQNPVMLYKLLRLVNSVMVGMKYKIQSVRHAITIVGRKQLKRWVLLSVFGDKEVSSDNPLFSLAASRGRFMELIAGSLPVGPQKLEAQNCAFITGLLSLVHTALGLSLENLCQELKLDTVIRLALIEKEGPLGKLLLLAENLEQQHLDEVEDLVGALGIQCRDVMNNQLETVKWVNSLG